MRGAAPELFTFRRSRPDELVDAVAGLWARRRGWVNCTPDTAGEPPPAPSGLGRWFGARGPAAPFATVVASARGPHQLGIEHAAGPKAVAALREAGLPLPAGWTVRQDHPRRGLVLDVPDGAAPDAVVEFLLAACSSLTAVSLADRWTAELHQG